MKELEKIAPKLKGITSMSVKDVVQSLVDDDLVDTDKIGTSIYFWAFPSKGVLVRKNRIAKYSDDIFELKKKISNLQTSIEKNKIGKEDSEERIVLQANYDELLRNDNELKKELSKYDDCNPKVLDDMKNHTKEVIDATNRWTDNIFALLDYCKNKLFIEKKQLYEYFNIPEDFDYIS